MHINKWSKNYKSKAKNKFKIMHYKIHWCVRNNNIYNKLKFKNN